MECALEKRTQHYLLKTALFPCVVASSSGGSTHASSRRATAGPRVLKISQIMLISHLSVVVEVSVIEARLVRRVSAVECTVLEVKDLPELSVFDVGLVLELSARTDSC